MTLKYITKIENGDAINMKAFIVMLPDKYKKNYQNVFFLTKSDGPYKYTLSIKDKLAWKEIKTHLQLPKAVTRTQAAVYNCDSHKTKVSYAEIVSVNGDGTNFNVSIFTNEKPLQSFINQNDELIIIENKELFFNAKFLSNLDMMYEGIHSNKCDVVLGNGVQITNDYFRTPFSKYKVIHCIFDYDLGGLKMFDHLVKSLPSCTVNFSVINNIYDQKNLFRMKTSPSKFNKAINYCKSHKLCDIEALLLESSRFMEQESLLTLIGN